jgi:hypothetical protein
MTMADEKKSDKVTVYMVGASRGNPDGQKRVLDADLAAELVENKHARYAGE